MSGGHQLNTYDLLIHAGAGHRLAMPLASASMQLTPFQEKTLALMLLRMNRAHTRQRRLAIGVFALGLIDLERWLVL